jgi:hypothetical protein
VSAIRNVGELASPYFLLEVWAASDELKVPADVRRGAKRLVVAARRAESRGEEPDDEWRVARRWLLGLDPLKELVVSLDDGSTFPLLLWRDDDGNDAVLVGDLPGFTNPDGRLDDATHTPAISFELALDAYDGDADWGLLLAGYEIRLYRRSSGISQQYLAVNLDTLVELDNDDASWRAFAGIFRAQAFALDANGIPLVRRVVDDSRRHATALAEDMRADVVDAAEALIQGVLDDPANRTVVGEPTRDVLHRLFEETLYYLYRVLFVLYAEGRGVLLLGAGPYATSYSIDHLVERARVEPEHAAGGYYHAAVRRLFGLLHAGPAELAHPLGIDPVGGELFDPVRTSMLDRCSIDDRWWRRALTSVAMGSPGGPRRRLGRRSSFAELGVDQLGSIYEGLLVMEPHLAAMPEVVVRMDGERRVLEPSVAGDLRVERELEPGQFVLESASGRRKGSGSFYTPAEITEYLARAAIDPLCEPIIAGAVDDPAGAVRDLLALRVCDPAMGSGAFLVQAARVLGLALATIRSRAPGSDGRVTPEMVRRAERDVVRRCLYGVDLNPLAVALAKVSLWLETLEPHRPLGFLDAHLRCGDSLVGVTFTDEHGSFSAAELSTWPANAAKGLRRYLDKAAGERGESLRNRLAGRRAPARRERAGQASFDTLAIEQALADLAVEREDLACTTTDCDTLQLELEVALRFGELEHAEDSLRNRLRDAANFWCAQWFSDGEDGPTDEHGDPVPPVTASDYATVVGCLLRGEAVPARLHPAVGAARQVHERRRFFHWALEFPEVMLERGGFDAVIGNPPWNETTPTTREFFATYDPNVFRKGVPKSQQNARQAELRQVGEVDAAWRTESRFLHELSTYARPESGRFSWYAPEGNLRKGDANVFRLFVERAYRLLRSGGRLSQVLPEAVYSASQATGVRRRLLDDGVLDRLWVFENRKALFPIHRSTKVALLMAQRGGGSTEAFRAAFFVGKGAAGQDRSVGLDDLPSVLAELDREAPVITVAQVRTLSPVTMAVPELQTALDAQIAAQCASTVSALNLDDRGWGLTFCRELDGTNDADYFHSIDDLCERGATLRGLRWIGPAETEWWPLIEGALFYHLEFLAEGKQPSRWVNAREMRAIDSRRNTDGTSTMEHYRVTWRDVASATNERSAIATLLPPSTAAVNSAWTVWGGLQSVQCSLGLATVLSSVAFDYLVRSRGRTHLNKGVIESVPAPSFAAVEHLVPIATEVVCRNEEFDALWAEIRPGEPRPDLDAWAIGERRAQLDAEVALAYGLSLEQFAAVLSTFPNLDTVQPMLPGEPKSFVTRDLALLAYCQATNTEPADVAELLAAVGVELPEPRPELRRLHARVARARELGAVPYRPTPRGGRAPTDPELIAGVRDLLTIEGQTVAEIAEALEEEERSVKSVLDRLVADGDAMAQGRGGRRRFYVLEEDDG